MPNWPQHIVAAGMLVHRDGEVLLVRTPRRGWEFPGGQIEEGESVLGGVVREVMEEANVAARVERLCGVYTNVTSSRLILDFMGSWVSGVGEIGPETEDVRWVDPGEAQELIEHPGYSCRLSHLLSGSSGVLYQTYSTDPFTILSEQIV